MLALQVRKRKGKTPEPPALDVNPLGAACAKMKVEQMIRGAAEACEKLEAEKARMQEADKLAALQAEAEKLRMDKLMSDVADACVTLEKAKARPVDDLIQNIFHSVMNSPV
jgi:hypothetical protein